jgi:hypothetical protein
MRIPARFLLGAAVVSSAIFAIAAVVRAETCTLEIKRVNRENPQKSDYVYQVANAQRIFVQIGKDGAPMGNQGPAAAFQRIVKKEPKYRSERPVRAVIKLGSQEYAFALDAIPPASKDAKADAEKTKKEENRKTGKALAPAPIGYNRLYFDLNHNGDLTDDKPIDVEPQRGPRRVGSFFQFPRIDLMIDDAGTKLDYSFFLEGQEIGASRDVAYVVMSMNPGAYREGDITLDGKKRHVILIDFNSNGRFNDEISISKDVGAPNSRVGGEPGDMLLVDPNPNGDPQYDVNSSDAVHNVSKVVNVGGRFYDVKISPAGDKLTLTPSSVPLGKVKNASGKFNAIIYGDLGVLDIRGEKDVPLPVPEGEWKLLSYTIDATAAKEPKKAEEKKEEKKPDEKKGSLESMAQDLNGLLGGSSESDTVVRQSTASAQATAGYKAVKVVKGETVLMPFGPPYKPVVTAEFFENGPKHDVLSLGLTLVGSAGEICNDMTVKGGSPSKPKFIITDAKGKVVEQGSFEYG